MTGGSGLDNRISRSAPRLGCCDYHRGPFI